MSTYVITEACIGLKDGTCVEVCPAACIHTTPDAPQYYIDPEICIACEQCFFVCPVDAIYKDEDVPAHLAHYLDINADFFKQNKLAAEPIDFPTAVQIINAVKTYAESVGATVAIAVVDPNGEELATGRTGAPNAETEARALNRAYTAALLQVGTHQLSRGNEKPATAAAAGFDDSRMETAAGGLPVFEGLEVRGAIGVAGGANPQQDLQCCQAGMEVMRATVH